MESSVRNKKRPREPSEPSETNESKEDRIVSSWVKKQARDLFRWIGNPANSTGYGFDPDGKVADVLNRISLLPDERKVRNPSLELAYEQLICGNASDVLDGCMMLSEFLTLYAARYVMLVYRDSYEMNCPFEYLKPDRIVEGSRPQYGGDFDWQELLDLEGETDADTRYGYEDFELLVRWKILDARDPFYPSKTPLQELKEEADRLWKDYKLRRASAAKKDGVRGGAFSDPASDSGSGAEVSSDLLDSAKAWWKMTDALLEED